MRRLLSAVFCALAITLAAPAGADDWRVYANGRFGYSIEVPASFSVTMVADNGDGETLASADGKAELLVWGSAVPEGDFAAEAYDRRNSYALVDGWNMSYEKTADHWTSFSGSKDGMILYVRGIELCQDTAAFFQLTYPQGQRKAYDAVIAHMVKTLKPVGGCDP